MVLVAMHGRAIRILLTHLLDLPLSEMDAFSHSNLCLYRLSYDYNTQKFSLDMANDTAHLAELLVK
jgi:probable phosphoglycerate mutase